MMEDERVWAVKRLLFDYVKSPSLRHIRDPYPLSKLAKDVVRALDRENSIWRKWDGQRELVAKSAVGCWIPIEDMRVFLNRMPGPALTTTDVAQRLRSFEEENHYSYPKEELQPGCLAIYEREKAEGTELPAIIGLLRDHVEQEEERLRSELEQQYRRSRDEAQAAQEQRLLSGADCKWTQFRGSPHWFCRVNGRTFRLSPTRDKRWDLYRVTAVADDEKGGLVGTYQARGDATKVIAKVAYEAEPRW